MEDIVDSTDFLFYIHLLPPIPVSIFSYILKSRPLTFPEQYSTQNLPGQTIPNAHRSSPPTPTKMETSMLSQLTNLLPSIKLPFLDRFTASVKSLPACEIHNLESATDKPARTLKHLLKLNHAKHAVLQRDNGLGVNYVPRVRVRLFPEGI